jgi:hypothetical protein
MLPNVAPEVDSGDALVDNAAVAQARINYDAETKEFERSLWRNFRICHDLHTYVETRSSELYSRYVKRDNCDEDVAYKLRVLRRKCSVCYTNAAREFIKLHECLQAGEQIPVNGNMYKAHRAAAEHEEQCDELRQLMIELDPWSGGSSSVSSEESDFEVATASGVDV